MVEVMGFNTTAMHVAAVSRPVSVAPVTPQRDETEVANEQPKETPAAGGRVSPSLVLASADSWLGCPYRSGGHDRSGFDCSGFTMTFFDQVLGISLIHSSRAQYEKNCSLTVKKEDLRTGDLVFFVTNGKQPTKAHINHVGIYLTDGRFIHSSTRGGVRIDRLDAPYYIKTWVTGGRVQ
jgi:lipoprotein Spr